MNGAIKKTVVNAKSNIIATSILTIIPKPISLPMFSRKDIPTFSHILEYIFQRTAIKIIPPSPKSGIAIIKAPKAALVFTTLNISFSKYLFASRAEIAPSNI